MSGQSTASKLATARRRITELETEAAALRQIAADRDREITTRDDIIERQRAWLAAQRFHVDALTAVASDMLGNFHATGDGHRARVGQVQIERWQQALARAGQETPDGP